MYRGLRYNSVRVCQTVEVRGRTSIPIIRRHVATIINTLLLNQTPALHYAMPSRQIDYLQTTDLPFATFSLCSTPPVPLAGTSQRFQFSKSLINEDVEARLWLSWMTLREYISIPYDFFAVEPHVPVAEQLTSTRRRRKKVGWSNFWCLYWACCELIGGGKDQRCESRPLPGTSFVQRLKGRKRSCRSGMLGSFASWRGQYPLVPIPKSHLFH